MFQKYFKPKSADDQVDLPDRPIRKYNWWMIIILPVWVYVGYSISQAIVTALVWLLVVTNVPIGEVHQTILSSVFAVILYLIMIGVLIFVPSLIRREKIDKSVLGLNRLPNWTDVALAPIGLVVYLIISTLLVILATYLLPWFNIDQPQETGFENLSQNYEYVMAFIILVIVAPISEEIVFRGYLYGKLKTYLPVIVATITASVMFGAVHGAWNLAVDTFALSLVLCVLREKTGSLWASILLHMTKNGVAYYILFINPSLLATLIK